MQDALVLFTISSLRQTSFPIGQKGPQRLNDSPSPPRPVLRGAAEDLRAVGQGRQRRHRLPRVPAPWRRAEPVDVSVKRTKRTWGGWWKMPGAAVEFKCFFFRTYIGIGQWKLRFFRDFPQIPYEKAKEQHERWSLDVSPLGTWPTWRIWANRKAATPWQLLARTGWSSLTPFRSGVSLRKDGFWEESNVYLICISYVYIGIYINIYIYINI